MTRAVRARSILALLTLALVGASCGGNSGNICAGTGCGAPPMCGVGCQTPCGCCSCRAGERIGDLVCTENGCYAPAPPTDGGMDGGIDSGWTPYVSCTLPFDPGPCSGVIPGFAFKDGKCASVNFSSCQGNENRFSTLEECLIACEGRPVPNGCPAGRVAKEICLQCGPAGGCSKSDTVCASACDVDAGPACASPLPICYDGVCQNAFCD